MLGFLPYTRSTPIQTFLPEISIQDSVKCLDKKRQFKQIIEAGQILDALKFRREGTLTNGKKPGWIAHPAVLQWANYEDALTVYHNIFFQYAVDVHVHKVKMVKTKLRKETSSKIEWPKWWGFPAYHYNHRARLLQKKPEHYSQFGWTQKPIMENYWPVDKNGLKPEITEWYNYIVNNDTGEDRSDEYYVQ